MQKKYQTTVHSAFVSAFILAASILSGCSCIDFGKPDQPPYEANLPDPYRQIEVKLSTSADVLYLIQQTDLELLSQSKSVIAAQGQRKDGYQIWFNMAGFDEDKFTVQRKYFFMIDEKPKDALAWLRDKQKFQFDAQTVLPSDILKEPYANENEKRIAILTGILDSTKKDIDQVAPDNKTFAICGAMINQAFTTTLHSLKESPVLAKKLDTEKGLELSHPNLNRITVKLALSADVATVEIDALPEKNHNDPFSLTE